MTTKVTTAFVDHPPEWNATATVTPVENFTETASLLISHSLSTIIDNKVAVRVTNTTETPYLFRNETQIVEFSLFTSEQSKFIQPVDTTVLSINRKGDPDLATYLNESFAANKFGEQNNTF